MKITEIRQLIKAHQRNADADLQPHLSNLEQMLKSWDSGGNRERLRPAIEQQLQMIERLTVAA